MARTKTRLLTNGRFLILNLILLLILAINATAWWNTSFAYRQNASINTTIGTELINFTPYMALDTATLVSGGKLQSNCADLRVINATDTAILPYQIENCNSDNTVVWLKLPVSAANNATSSVYVYYGNATAADAQAASSVWSDYEMVYHFDNNLLDSSSHSRTLTNIGSSVGYLTSTLKQVNGSCQFANCVRFNATNTYLSVAYTNTRTGAVRPLLYVWGKKSQPGANYNRYFSLSDKPTYTAGSYGNIYWTSSASGTLSGSGFGTSGDTSFANVGTLSQTMALYGIRSTSAAKFDIFRNYYFASQIDNSPNLQAAMTYNLGAGWSDDEPYTGTGGTGTLDEARVEMNNRSSDWITALVMQTFTMSAEDTLPCISNYSCYAWGDCNASNVQPCLSVTDNTCFTQYTGDLSDFDLPCDYCVSNYSCILFGDCLITGLKLCENVSDITCNRTFEGNLSDYTANCTYTPTNTTSTGSTQGSIQDITTPLGLAFLFILMFWWLALLTLSLIFHNFLTASLMWFVGVLIGLLLLRLAAVWGIMFLLIDTALFMFFAKLKGR